MNKIFSSFRDPCGYIYEENGKIYRYVAPSYKQDYDKLINSGLYAELIKNNRLIKTKEITPKNGAYKLLEVEKIDFISYPYEWSFNAYKDAALLTLKVQKSALMHNMTLKDASAYNVQFHNGNPVFIDTLSFENLDEKAPWAAYKQFCQHFLAPLSLMSLKDVRLSCLMKQYIDGIPLDLASELLPFNIPFGLWLNIRLNAYFQKKYETSQTPKNRFQNMSKTKHLALIEGLTQLIKNLKSPTRETTWENYYDLTNYNKTAFKNKENLLTQYIKSLKNVKLIADFGANNGYFTNIALKATPNAKAVAFDIDVNAVEKNYMEVKKNQKTNLLPLVLDVLNPSPGIGWDNREREDLKARADFDVIMALALIHHLSISANIPFDYLASYFANFAPYLIIEFVPKDDSQVQKLLASRADIFPWYCEDEFEKAFKKYYTIVQKDKIKGSLRSLYLLKRK